MEWWVNDESIRKIVPSIAEKRIIDILKSARIKYFREVSFKKCNSKKGFPLRFDFYFPHKNLLLEYDGKQHSKKENKINDGLKNQFAADHGIFLVRLNRRSWGNLEHVVLRTLKKFKRKKSGYNLTK